MSFEQIISEIRQRPEMWSCSHNLYKNRAVRAKVWRELSQKMDVQGDILKKRWKHLKDQYRKELKKQLLVFETAAPGTESDVWVSTWQYFDRMSFMRNEISPAPPPPLDGATAAAAAEGEVNLNIMTYAVDHTYIPNDLQLVDMDTKMVVVGPVTYNKRQPSSSPAGGSSMSNSSSTKSSCRKRINEQRRGGGGAMIEIERKRSTEENNRSTEDSRDAADADDAEVASEDEDFLFLRSILPSMKRLTDIQKLQFRGKINQWLLEAMTQNTFYQHNQVYFPKIVHSGVDNLL